MHEGQQPLHEVKKIEQLNHEWYLGSLSESQGEVAESESILIPAARYNTAPEILRDTVQYWVTQHQNISQGGYHPLGGTVVGDYQSILSYIYGGSDYGGSEEEADNN